MRRIRQTARMGVVYSVLLCSCLLLIGCGKSAATCFRQGVTAASKGNTKDAIALLLQAIEKNPEKAEYYIELGILQTVDGQLEEARNSYTKAIVEKGLPITLTNNKNAYRGIAITYYQEADYDNAILWFDKTFKIKIVTGSEDDNLRYYARCLRQLFRYEEAIQTYEILMEKDMKDIALYEELAELYRLTHQPTEALRYYDKILELEPQNYSVYFEKYDAWMEEGNPEMAKSVLQKVLDISEPDELESFYIGKAKFVLSQPDAMDQLLRCAADGFLRAYFYVGEYYFQKNNWQDALTYYELAKEPQEQGIIYYRMAECCYALEDYQQAVNYALLAEEYVTMEQKQAMLRLEIIALEKQGSYEQAYERLLMYQTRYPEDTTASKEQEYIELKWNKQ